MTLDEIMAVYKGSNGEVTTAFYKRLDAAHPLGPVAVNLFRACKTSERAKAYRKGPGHKTASYERKDWSIANASRLLAAGAPPGHPPFQWGWQIDRKAFEKGDPHVHVVYFDLPTGQVSFHVGGRGDGPDYRGEWDGAKQVAAGRICSWIAKLFEEANGATQQHGTTGQPVQAGAAGA